MNRQAFAETFQKQLAKSLVQGIKAGGANFFFILVIFQILSPY